MAPESPSRCNELSIAMKRFAAIFAYTERSTFAENQGHITMAHLTDTFALCARPNGVYAWDPTNGGGFTLTPRKKKFCIRLHGVGEPNVGRRLGADEIAFPTEEAAWGYAQSRYPGFVPHLLQHGSLSSRALATRAQLFLTLGETAVQARISAVDEEIFLIHRHALAALSVTVLDEVAPKIARENKANFIGWLRVDQEVLGPVTKGPMELGVCFLPSPIQDKTWSVQFALNTTNDEMLEWLQLGHDRLTERLALEGIRIKDVLSGIRTI